MADFGAILVSFRRKLKNLLFRTSGSFLESDSLDTRKVLLEVDTNPHAWALLRILSDFKIFLNFLFEKRPKNGHF